MLMFLSVISEEEKAFLSRMIVLTASGDQNALQAIYNTAGGRLLSVAMGLVRSLPLAEDILHDSFIKIVKSADTFRPGTNGYAWLCAVVRNTALNKIKSEKLRKGEDIDSFFNLTDGADFTKNHAEAERIEKAVKQLKPRERTAVWLRYYNEMTVREIAAEMGIGKSTAAELIKTAEEKLKKLLQGADN